MSIVHGMKNRKITAEDAEIAEIDNLSGCVGTRFQAIRWNEMPENPAPEGEID